VICRGTKRRTRERKSNNNNNTDLDRPRSHGGIYEQIISHNGQPADISSTLL
jgi:hypothetical protein